MNNQELIKETKLYTRWAMGLSLVLVVIWPGIMFATGYVYSLKFFEGWLLLAFVWLILAALFITIRPLFELYKEYKR
jgi:ABC-type Fe3+ transport system permease subunit